MTDAAASTSTSWNIPPRSQSGDVPWLDRLIVRRRKAKDIWVARAQEPREKGLLDMLSEVSQQMHINHVPKLLIYDSKVPNAASSITGNIMLSTNLRDSMTDDQVKAVMGHELMHHKKRVRDWLLNTATDMAVFVVGIFAFDKGVKKGFPEFAAKLRSSKAASTMTNIVEAGMIFLGLKPLQRWRQRQQEYRSDQAGAEVAGPVAMIGALDTLENRSKEISKEKEQQGKKHTRSKKPWFLQTHPTHNKRIARIVEDAPKSFADEYLASHDALAGAER